MLLDHGHATDRASLQWVHGEIENTLNPARRALEAFAEGGGGAPRMQECATALHGVRGVLEMLELYGVSLLTEEMEEVARALAQPDFEGKDEACEVLMRAIVQLPEYLEYLRGGNNDNPLLLMPLLNDLRRVRGQPPFSDGALFNPDLDAPIPFPAEQVKAAADAELRNFARRLRPYFEKGLLGWLSGKPPADGLDLMRAVVRRLEQALASGRAVRLWWVATGFIDALKAGLEPSVAVKRLLAQLDQQLKRLSEHGTALLDQPPPKDLMKDLLYYIARASDGGERVKAVREAFGLEALLAGGADQEYAGPTPGASLDAINAVADSIKEGLAKVKDGLDGFVSSAGADGQELRAMADTLKTVADILGLLNLGHTRKNVLEQAAKLRAFADAGTVPGEADLMHVASLVINVDTTLDQLAASGGPRPADAGAPAAGDAELGDRDYLQLVSRVINEAKTDLALVKDAVSTFAADQAEHSKLRDTQVQLKQVEGGLRMLSLRRAADLLESWREYVQTRVLEQRLVLSEDLIDKLAETVAGVEYYLEAVAEEQPQSAAILDRAEACLLALQRAAVDQAPLASDQAPLASDQEPPASDQAPLASDKAPLAAEEPPRDEQRLLPGMVADNLREAQSIMQRMDGELRPQGNGAGSDFPALTLPEDIDEEILDIFIEESEEVIETLDEYLPQWTRNVDDQAALAAVRRSFHTLKGSGRLVGAAALGEFAWAVEDLLNRVIERITPASPEAVALVNQAHEALPALIGELKGEGAAGIDVAALVRGAREIGAAEPAVAAAERGNETARLEADSAAILAFPKRSEAAAPADATKSDSLQHVFRSETLGHLAQLRLALGREEPDRSDPAVYVRAFHTIRGSAQLARMSEVAELAGAMEEFLTDAIASGRPLDEPCVVLLRDCVDELDGCVQGLEGGNECNLPGRADLLSRIHELSRGEADRGAERATDSDAGLVHEQAELSAIFIDEAGEIIEASDAIIQRWRESPDDVDLITELQRELHTLKGSARMAHVSAIGDLGHSMESLLSLVVDGHVTASAKLVDLMRDAHDRLAAMLDALRDGDTVAAADDLMDRVDALVSPGVAARDLGPAPDEGALDEAAPEAGDTGETERRFESRDKGERIQVHSNLLDNLVNLAGEIGISQSRIGQQISAFKGGLDEMERTISRLRDQLRRMDMETESQIIARHQEGATKPDDFNPLDFRTSSSEQQLRESQMLFSRTGKTPIREEDFDPLEFDRFSTIQQLSRGLMESASDLGSIQDMLGELSGEAEGLLGQQSRLNTELQQGLMRTRMLPFSRQVPRFQRIARQTCAELGKQAELRVEGGDILVDRTIANRMLGPLEHMLRNALDHGIEAPSARRALGKPEMGTVMLAVSRDGSEVVIEMRDDGEGLDLDAIRETALKRGIIGADADLSDDELAQLVLEPAFSTAGEVTQISGRGVGMDVVNTEIKQLGGALHIHSQAGGGARFVIRLPFTLAINQALMVNVGEETFAIPLANVEAVERAPLAEVKRALSEQEPLYEHGAEHYGLTHLGTLLGVSQFSIGGNVERLPLVLVRAGEHRIALLVDALVGRQEIVVKPLGPQLSAIRWLTGATIQGDGRVVLILDVPAVVRASVSLRGTDTVIEPVVETKQARAPTVMVVDDSITVRKVTERLLDRNGLNTLTAKDGVEALAMLQEHRPDIMLLDIEMPRMDGFELATTIRNDARLKDLPIIMITSRSGTKHSERARQIGVNRYLGKPYQEVELMDNINALLAER